MTYGEYKGKTYDDRHGGPFDRGAADSYYGRPRSPHFYVEGTGTSPIVEDLTSEEIDAYHAGYDFNEEFGDRKDWG